VTCHTQPCRPCAGTHILHYLPQGVELSPRGSWGICAPALPEVLTLKLCLLSTQSWCQSADDNFPRRDGTWQYQTADKFVMEWDQRKFRRTVPWDRRTNTGRMRSAPGTKHYRAFASVHNQKQECHKHEHVAYAHVIPDDRTGAGSERGQTPASAEDESIPPVIAPNKNEEENLTDFFQESQGPNIILDDDSD
jgi:hypothetical protein